MMERQSARPRRARRTLGAALAALGLVMASAAAAEAHTPIILGRHDVAPWTSPLILDGTNPVALYGVLPRCASVRSAQFEMKSGQRVTLAYGIPDEAPESDLPTSRLPDALLISPSGAFTVLTPKTAQPIKTEQGFTLLLVDLYQAPAEQGTYSVLVFGGCTPERFVVALGQDPGGFAGVLRGHVATDEQVQQWWDTAPGGGS